MLRRSFLLSSVAALASVKSALAVTGSRRVLFGGGIPAWVPNSANPPSLAINWKTNQAWQKNAGLTSPAALGITTSRASVKQVVDSAGNWSQVAANVTARSNLGRSTEEARTNSIRNNTMQGAVAGTPGTLPTNWTDSHNTGITPNVVSTGTENGIDYIELQFSGTTSGTNNNIYFDTANAIAALYGQTWAASFFYRISAGSLTNITNLQIGINGTDGASNLEGFQGIAPTPTASYQRVALAATLATKADTNIRPFLQLVPVNAAAINITLRIGWPQLENNGISSTVASATVAAGGTTGVTGTAVYSVGGGTGTAATLNVTVSGGAITAINSVASAGSYSVFPPSPAALTYVSGTGSGVVGATVNLTPTNLAANAFATSPIKTTAGAATRAADVTTLTGQTFGAAYSMFEQATPQAPNGSVNNQEWLNLSDGTITNDVHLRRQVGTGNPLVSLAGGTTGTLSPTGGPMAQNAQSKFAGAFAAGSQAAVINGGTVATAALATLPPGVNQLNFGCQPNTPLQINGLAAIDAIWLTQAVPSAQLQAMTT